MVIYKKAEGKSHFWPHTYVDKNVAFRPENSSSDQNLRFTSLSEMTNIPDLSHESPFPPTFTFSHGSFPPTHTHTHLHMGVPTHPRTSKRGGA